ncbi:hypothetical protein RHIZO_03498 [Rhizobiaceae bacterium]|nr:hypothetical protein RHIZO_03498 [Rhizobiaceae bacterium]
MYRLAWIAALMTGALAPSHAATVTPELEVLGSFDSPAEGMNGYRIEELSGLAWDADEKLLYAVSDTGILHHFRIRLEGGRVTHIEVVHSAPLTAEDGTELAVNDAEDVAVVNGGNGKANDSELLIAIEDGPAVARFTPQGKRIANVVLPGPLADKTQYPKKNRRLESVAFDARYGVVTAPETALLGQPEDQHTLYATDGRKWSFKAFRAGDSNVKAIEIMPDGNALVLERTREAKGALFVGRLRRVDIAGCGGNETCGVTDFTPVPAAGLANNFEGMTSLGDDMLLLVTDETAKDGKPTIFTLVAFKPASQ